MTFAMADDNLMLVKIYIFDPQADTFHQTQTGAVQQACHQSIGVIGTIYYPQFWIAL
jgi:hypothetical protein